MQTALTTTTTPTDTALTSLVDKARQFAENSKAANTIRAYEADWQQFTVWCAAHSLPNMPACPGTVALYITDLAGGSKVATIIRRLAAISKVHQAAGHESPCAMKHAVVKEVLDGIHLCGEFGRVAEVVRQPPPAPSDTRHPRTAPGLAPGLRRGGLRCALK
jgi:hypothetical protein